MPWLYLFLAGLLETTWLVMLKVGQQTDRLWPKLAAIGLSVVSMLLLNLAMEKIPMGTSYAVWTGVGALGSTVLGILFFSEQFSLFRVVCIVLILVGLTGLKISSSPPPPPNAQLPPPSQKA